jgi:hypothetical protein
MDIWLAVLIGSILVSVSVLVLAGVLFSVGRHFDGVANMFFAVTTMQLRLELDECGYECPNWLKIMDDDDEPLEMPPPTDLKLVKLEKDKKEKE